MTAKGLCGLSWIRYRRSWCAGGQRVPTPVCSPKCYFGRFLSFACFNVKVSVLLTASGRRGEIFLKWVDDNATTPVTAYRSTFVKPMSGKSECNISI